MNILLHICCAPCAIAPVEDLRKEGREVEGFFYNPNIHPYSEYLKRKGEVEKYAGQANFAVTYSDYDIENYFQRIAYNEGPPPYQDFKQPMADPLKADKNRCPICWRLRLERAARYAGQKGFDAFTTTLLGSPYQDQETVKKIASDIAKSIGLNFYYKDFRPYFREAHARAKSKGIYCQNYCGCVFSEKERIEKKHQSVKV